MPSEASVDPEEIARFDRLAQSWWNPRGPMRALHQFNPVRVAFLSRLLGRHFRTALAEAPGDRPLAGLAILDIGCGGGILSEALCRLGGAVTAIDPAPANIAVGRRHAEQEGLAIDYLCTTAEALAADGKVFDAVLAMEVVEHVRDVQAFIATAATMVRANGICVVATLNRTAKSYLFAIVGAEYVLGWLPKGTHRWEHFVTPRELARALKAAGLHPVAETGVVFNPFRAEWQESRDMDVNYTIAAERKG